MSNYPPLTMNFAHPNGAQVPIIGVPQNPIRRFTSARSIKGLGCGGGCGCSGCSGGSSGGVVNTLAGVGRRSLRGITLGQLDETQVGLAVPRWLQVTHGILSLAGGAMGGYHGWKRSRSALGVVGYGALGVFLPVIGIPVMLAQGFAKRKGR